MPKGRSVSRMIVSMESTSSKFAMRRLYDEKQQSLKKRHLSENSTSSIAWGSCTACLPEFGTPFQSIIIYFFTFVLNLAVFYKKMSAGRPAPMGKREKLSEQTGSPSTPGETFFKAAGQYAGLEDDVQHYWPGCDGNRESPRSYERGLSCATSYLKETICLTAGQCRRSGQCWK